MKKISTKQWISINGELFHDCDKLGGKNPSEKSEAQASTAFGSENPAKDFAIVVGDGGKKTSSLLPSASP